jgi:hypothetical protein
MRKNELQRGNKRITHKSLQQAGGRDEMNESKDGKRESKDRQGETGTFTRSLAQHQNESSDSKKVKRSENEKDEIRKWTVSFPFALMRPITS